MNFKQIIINGFIEHLAQETTYLSYFKREAKIANTENFEFSDFFNGCNEAISYYKKDIENKYNKRFTENDWVLHSYKQKLLNGETTNQNGQLIQEHIERIENEKEFVKKRGYKTNYDYRCFITEIGEIKERSLESKYELYYSDIENIENAIIQAESEQTVPTSDNKKKQSKINKRKRVVNEEDLKLYFVSSFKGMGNDNINYFEKMIYELKTDRSTKEFAQIAYLIYNSKQMNQRKLGTFSKWLRIFYNEIDVSHIDYKPNKLKNPNEKLTKLFNYLL